MITKKKINGFPKRTCQEHRPSQQNGEIIQTETPKRDFEHVSMNFSTCYRKNYLVYTDCLSGWPCIENIGNDLSTNKLIHTCKKWFSQYAYHQQSAQMEDPNSGHTNSISY